MPDSPQISTDADGRRRLLDHLVDLPHLGAVADHLAEGAVVAELAPQHLHLAARVLPLDDLVEQDLQPLRLDRLGQVVVGAFLDRLDGGLDRALRRENDDGQLAALLLERAQQLEAAHARHHEVADDDGGAEGGDTLERFFAVGGGLGGKPPRTHELGEPEPGRRIVFDDQNAVAGSCAWSQCA